MKKLIYLLALIFATSFFVSCEEEEEPAQTLTAFVIGDWISQEVPMGDTPAIFYADIEVGFYTLTITGGGQSFEIPTAGYVIDEENSLITIDQPQMPGEDPSDDVIPFKVEWEEHGNTMTWLPVDPLENDAHTLIWTRSTGM